MPEPYYQDDLVTLYHGDCLEITEWLAADVLVTDPPYGMKYTSRGFHKLHHKGQRADPVRGDESTEVRDSALRLWGEDRPALMFGRWSIERPSATKQVLTWDKGNHTGMGNTNIPWRPSTEDVYVLGNWPNRPSLGRGGGGRISPVLRINAPTALSREQGRNHPTEKPVQLMAALISKCPIGVVSDPFAGSGPTLIAARNHGRKVIGVEIEERYCELIVKRLSQQAFDLEALS